MPDHPVGASSRLFLYLYVLRAYRDRSLITGVGATVGGGASQALPLQKRGAGGVLAEGGEGTQTDFRHF